MVITIPIQGNRFYYNRKTNCMPATGWVESGRNSIRSGSEDLPGEPGLGQGHLGV